MQWSFGQIINKIDRSLATLVTGESALLQLNKETADCTIETTSN